MKQLLTARTNYQLMANTQNNSVDKPAEKPADKPTDKPVDKPKLP